MPPKQNPIKPKLFQADIDTETFDIYSKDDSLAIDCEMMGLNPRRDRLCLIQMCDSHNNFSVIQVLPEQKSAPNIQALMENNEITKIFHFARMDLIFLKTYLHIQSQNVFCTKIASRLARTYTDKHGLKELIKEFFTDIIDKKNQSSDWGKRNLSKDQIEYACEDVRYLISLKQILEEMLYREKRLELAKKCFEFIPSIIELDQLEMKEIFEH